MDATRARFESELGFELDAFQREALDALDAGGSVVVAAPTGSGKTVVAQYAVSLAIAGGHKAFYTTPLKALSNQKYGELVRRHGASSVGLLTGDNSINGDAPVVVMTTEVLRNMIYSAAPALDNLRYVVLDDMHVYRGVFGSHVGLVLRRLWRTCRVHGSAPQVICTSATIANPQEFGSRLTGRPLRLVDDDGAPRGPRGSADPRPGPAQARAGARARRRPRGSAPGPGQRPRSVSVARQR